MRLSEFKLSIRYSIGFSAALGFLSWSPLSAQPAETPSTCSVHFQARADWMRGLDGKHETIDLMETYAGILDRHAEALWLSAPRDWGMQTGVFPNSNRLKYRHRPYQDAVLDQLIKWALEDQSSAQRPLCMEDVKCIECTALLRNVVQTLNHN